jgi:di/tricarboxylate transporter
VGSADEPADEPADEHPDPLTRRPSERTVAPWSWPLAESEPTTPEASHSSAAASLEETPEPATTSPPTGSESEEWAPVFEGAGESSFFQRDEPVGSQFVDFDEVRTELVQIGIMWLGEANAVPVTALLRKTRSTIDDFVATIDTIRGLHLEGQDPASVQAMAREMHQQAAERLCGA